MLKNIMVLVCAAVVVLALWILLKAVFAVGIMLNYLLPALLPFIFALILSFVLEPIIAVLQRKGHLPRGLAVFVAMLIVFGGVGFILAIILIKLVAELIQLSHSVPGVAADLMAYAQDFVNQAMEIYVHLPSYATSSIEQSISSIASNVQVLVTSMANSIVYYLSVVPGTVAFFAVTAIATYFLSRDRNNIKRKTYKLIPAPWDEKVDYILKEVLAGFGGYIKAQLIIMSISMVISIIGLYILGANYTLTIGLLAGLLEILPVVGPGMVYLPWILWCFVSGNISFAVKLIILFGILIGVRQTFEAKIISVNLGLYPLAVLMAMYGGLKIIGVSGLIIGPIILVAVQAVIKSGVFSKPEVDR